jgi:hypothetical protein
VILLLSPLYLLGLYIAYIQYERGGLWCACKVFAIVGFPLDVVLNYTYFALLTLDFPKHGEWTFSKRLERLQYDYDWRGDVARYIAGILDAIAPSGKHIKD